MIWGVDSAYPGDPVALAALGYGFACGYLGPIGGTPHVWTAADWQRHAAAGLKLGPIWVAPYGQPSEQEGVDHGNRALSAMQANHLSGMVLLDVENGATPRAYIKGFIAACHAGSCAVGLYGSQTTIVTTGDLPDAWWLAAWLPLAGMAPPDWSMWQCGSVVIRGVTFDLDVAVDDFPFATYNP
jgi:Domain of unknown function (DUF1906)